MEKNAIETVLRYLDNAGSGICPVTGKPFTQESLLSARVSFYDLARHIREHLHNQPHENQSTSEESSSSGSAMSAGEQTVSTARPKPPANSGKTWTDEDISVCIAMYHDRFPLGDIGLKIHRSPWSVAVKLNQLGELGDEAFERLRVEMGKDAPQNSMKGSRKGG